MKSIIINVQILHSYINCVHINYYCLTPYLFHRLSFEPITGLLIKMHLSSYHIYTVYIYIYIQLATETEINT